ncbi:MAG TPA: hypothetical protein VLD57_05580, partial [Blastocatellia bacterium]|nr:hypothetical protein [Blastocatellia bacterium]
CGAERPARELHNEPMPEWSVSSINAPQISKARLVARPVEEPDAARGARAEQIVVAQGQTRKLALVK